VNNYNTYVCNVRQFMGRNRSMVSTTYTMMQLINLWRLINLWIVTVQWSLRLLSCSSSILQSTRL